MQLSILLITLGLMGVAGWLILRAVWATEGPSAPKTINRTRSCFLWGMIAVGVVISVGSLREWPHTSAADDALIVNITSGQWWWETDTTEIPFGRQVEFRVTTEDVNHGLGIYDPDMNLVVQVQAMPTYTNKVVHTFDKAGQYQILCMEFCGIAHHEMTYDFEVLEQN
ncbi:cytochrome C oxidase subunit I [Parasedimentitalea maritima]|uniref:Cytochrome C oxidase subunit I n=1 Tax=Parasedimentitalea maritima TaxID=2578117 RepID=A0A6A4RB30_9RHOB|nr:cytochrome C oxidase subunit I [Zongyanglinia marina]KAE9630368.1 cytochrome C oxidase subunit I [Zongyanglinia marina]